MRKNMLRVATIAVLGVAPLVAATTSAHAGGARDDYFVNFANTQWLDRGSVPGLLGGNVHRGVISTSDDQATPGWDNLNGWLVCRTVSSCGKSYDGAWRAEDGPRPNWS